MYQQHKVNMSISTKACSAAAALAVLVLPWTVPALAQAPVQPDPTGAPITAPVPGGAMQGAEPSGSLVLLFGSGSTTISAQNQAILDQASRLYREGRPIIMIVSGSTDAVGVPARNLILSQQRANAVARGLLARGIPAERTQILAKGETNPAVPASRGVPEAQNRRVEITWR